MSELDLLRDEDLRTEREEVKEPAKRWRNWWRGVAYNWCKRCGRCGRPGEVYSDCCDPAWPSRDVAESSAADQIAFQVKYSGMALEDYLGAFPEGERP